MNKRRVGNRVVGIMLSLFCCWLVLITSTAAEEISGDRISKLLSQVDSLRVIRAYDEALEVARKLLKVRINDEKTRSYQVDDSKRLIETLETVVTLSPELQMEMSHADSLKAAIETMYATASYADGKVAAEEQLEIYRRILGEGHFEVASSLNNLANFVYSQGDQAGAEKLFREALSIYRKALGDDHPDVATALHNIAILKKTHGGLDEAISHASEALEIRRNQLGEHTETANTIVLLASLHYDKGDYPTAEPLYIEALEMHRTVTGEEHRDYATTLNHLGTLYLTTGDFKLAKTYYRQTLDIRRRVLNEGHPHIAGSLGSLASAHQALGEFAEAESLMREALNIHMGIYGKEHIETAVSLAKMGALLQARGDYASAEPLFRESVAVFRKLLGDGHSYVAIATNNFAALVQEQGDNLRAERLYREALEIYKKTIGEDHAYVAATLSNLATVCKAEHKYGEAEVFLREAIEKYTKILGNDHPWLTDARTNLAALREDQGDVASAESLYRQALADCIKKYGSEHPRTAKTQLNLGEYFSSQKRYEEAEPLLREASTTFRRFLGDAHPDVATSYHNLAALLWAKGDHQACEAILLDEAKIYESARLRAGGAFKRATFKRSPYSSLAAARLAMGKTDDTWHLVEKDRGRLLAELLITLEKRSLTTQETDQEDSLRVNLAQLERELIVHQKAALTDTTQEAATNFEDARIRLLALEAEWSRFQSDIAKKYPVTEGQAYELDQVQAKLDSKTAIIGWLDVDPRQETYLSWIYVIRSEGPVVWARVDSALVKKDVSPSERCSAFRRMVGNRNSPTVALHRQANLIWRVRFNPVKRELEDVERLIVVPSEEMLGIPIEVLIDDSGVPVGEQYAVSYTPSATVYSWLTEQALIRRGSSATNMLLVGDPPFSVEHLASMQAEQEMKFSSPDSQPDIIALQSLLRGNREAVKSLPRLPGSRYEVSRIADIVPHSTLLLGQDATEQKLASMAASGKMGEYNIIHIATHAIIDDMEPERSSLVMSQVDLPDPFESALAGERIYDGLVSAAEIVQEWHLDADLVTLSACETGLGRELYGEGYIGFSHACFQAGARNLLVGLWKVDDRATALLMERFYRGYFNASKGRSRRHRRRSITKAAALQQAKEWLRNMEDEEGNKPYEHPFYWSAFVLIGSGE